MNRRKMPGIFTWLIVLALCSVHQTNLAQEITGKEVGVAKSHLDKRVTEVSGYVARQESMRAFFGAISSYLGKPIIVSKTAAARQISGEFDFKDGDIVSKISRQLGLINYYDGNAIYIYDASETKNSVIQLKNISPKTLISFLTKSGLSDPRYPLRGDSVDTFYLSGPPIYVDLVTQAASLMDSQTADLDDQRVEVIKLQNTFVTDRAYTRREENILIPGIATIIEKLLASDQRQTLSLPVKKESPPSLLDSRIELPVLEIPPVLPETQRTASQSIETAPKLNIRVIAYPETNSLLVKGTVDQIRFVRNLVESLDEQKRHVELALWIIDLQKDDLDQLGVNWQGSVSIGNFFGAGLNTEASLNSFSTLESSRFVASILALSRENKAQIVSRPVLLTQENTPAMFDNNRTFYTPLIAERAVELQQVTYGTLVHVLPRFTSKDEIELSLNIEDGSEIASELENKTNTLPTVGRTKISTVARVPKGKSLLVGGYTRGESGQNTGKIPLLGDLPYIGGAFRYNKEINKNTVRLFLIQPREITESLDIDTRSVQEEVSFEALIKKLDKTRETAAINSESHYHGS